MFVGFMSVLFEGRHDVIDIAPSNYSQLYIAYIAILLLDGITPCHTIICSLREDMFS